ncbi:MAG: right-handed parallel beta-helix repeat-containing protein [Nanoarchaeota archaeon]
MKKIKIFLLLGIIVCLVNFSFAKDCGGDIACECGDTLTESRELSFRDNLKSCQSYALKVEVDNINLDCLNNKITGFTYFQNSGIIITSNNVTIENCDVSGFYNGVESLNSKFGNLINNNFSNNLASGIELKNVFNYRIFNNSLNANDWDGIFLINSSNNNISNNIIQYNTIDGIQIFGNSFNNYIAQNDLRYNFGHAIAPINCNNEIVDLSNIGGSGNPIKYIDNENRIKINDGKYSEIILCGVNKGILENIQIINGEEKSDGVLVVNSQNIVVRNSHFTNVRAGIYFYNTTSSEVYNNTVENSDFGLRFMKHSTHNDIYNNIIKSNNEIFLRVVDSFDNNFKSNQLGEEILDISYKDDFDLPLDVLYNNTEIVELSTSEFIEKKTFFNVFLIIFLVILGISIIVGFIYRFEILDFFKN